MKIVTPPLDISDNEGFEQDILGREAYGKALLNLVIRSNDELVISLDGQWGEGKTTFIKMWQGLLNKENVPNIYIDAFGNDFVDDAFISVASAITGYADKHTDSVAKGKVKAFKETTKKIGVKVLSLSGKVAINAMTFGALSSIDVSDKKAIAAIAKGVSEIGSNLIEEKLNSHSENVKLLSNFRQSLSELSQFLGEKNGKPLVIIIDELDRCRPTYAVEVLEKIKHLFSVENVVFVLVMNKQQLEESIKSVYGQNIDSHAYLQKFITVETRLPKRSGKLIRNKSDIETYCVKLMELHEIQAWGKERTLLNGIESLATQFNLSLRQIEKVFSSLSLFVTLSNESDYMPSKLISFLCVLQVKYPDITNKLWDRTISFEELCKRTGPLNNDWAEYIDFYMMSEAELERRAPNKFDRWESSQHGIPHTAIIPFFIHKLNMFDLAHL